MLPPIIQFDPASMSILYDVHLVGSVDSGEQFRNAVTAAILGDAKGVRDELSQIKDRTLRGRGLQITSAFWHEKRHFLDFVATNYGAFRFRQFLEVYANVDGVLNLAAGLGKLCCPIEVYADPVRSNVMGIENAPPQLEQLGRAFAKKRKMVEKDRQPLASRFGPMDVGGEAQLETLAYLAQMRFIHNEFGIDGMVDFRNTIYDFESFANKYFVFVETAVRLGLFPTLGEDGGSNVVRSDAALLECILFAALQADYGPLDPAHAGAKVESSYPADRFAALAIEIKAKHPNINQASPGSLRFDECWKIVNTACENVFGYTVCDQIARDVEYFEKQFESNIYGNVNENIETVARDYTSLRKKILRELQKSPFAFVSTELFVLNTAARVEPNYVACASDGVLGDPPEGHVIIMGYKHSELEWPHTHEAPYTKWWWACVKDFDSEISSKSSNHQVGKIGFEHPRAWSKVMDFYAPISKLILNGRRIRTMLGPELFFAERRLKSLYNVEISIYPSFEFPDETFTTSVYFYYYGKETLKCDLTAEIIKKPNGKVLTPWTLRRWPRLARHVIEAMGGHDLAYFKFVRDWSPWVVSDKAFEDVKQFMQPEKTS